MTEPMSYEEARRLTDEIKARLALLQRLIRAAEEHGVPPPKWAIDKLAQAHQFLWQTTT